MELNIHIEGSEQFINQIKELMWTLKICSGTDADNLICIKVGKQTPTPVIDCEQPSKLTGSWKTVEDVIYTRYIIDSTGETREVPYDRSNSQTS